MYPFIYNDGSTPKLHDVVSFSCEDFDDNTSYTFVCVLHQDHFVYLSGGMDFGTGIGKIMSFEEVMSIAENNDDYSKGINKVGVLNQLPSIISNGFKVN